MPNIHGLYSLSEVALKLNVSSAWINKIQKRTGIVQKEGGKGKPSFFSERDIEVLKNVKLLRVLDYSLEDIRDLYNQEKEMLKYIVSKPISKTKKGLGKYIIHYPHEFSEEDFSEFKKELSVKGVDDAKDLQTYREIERRMEKTFSEVKKRAERLQEDLKRFF